MDFCYNKRMVLLYKILEINDLITDLIISNYKLKILIFK